jgi:hypothetical protein
MIMRSIEPAIRELERAFWALSPLFVGVAFPQPVIAIQTRGRRAASGWFCRDRWGNNEDGKVSEITVTAEGLRRPTEDIASTLVHEMAHYANALAGINDCSVNQYHNKRFKERAESVGLVVTKGSHGWAQTTPGPALLGHIQDLAIDPDAFTLFRHDRAQAKAPTRMKKWSCDCTTIRAAVTVKVTCRQCGLDFRKWEN